MSRYEQFYQHLYRIFSRDPALNATPLEQLLDAIPTVDQLPHMPEGTVVLVRADLDMPIKNGRVADLSRIEANSPTIEYCVRQGWTVVIFGHLGRDKNISVEPVCRGYSEEIGRPIELVSDWLDESRMQLLDPFVEKIKASPPAKIYMLENTRKYDIERALWKADEEKFPGICRGMYTLAGDFRERVTEVEINEAIAASNLDFSSSVLPLAMSKTALGSYISDEMKKHIKNARRANLVVISGLKINKLDDLESILERRCLKRLIVAGSLAMALKKAESRMEGKDFSIGKAETDKEARFYISPQRVDQGKRIIERCREDGVDLILPADFVLEDSRVSETIPAGEAQLDIGPRTRNLISEKIEEYISESRESSQPFAMYYNGVFGKFEDQRYESGTREFIPLLGAMTRAGIHTYVGGGEGRLALLKYGSLSDVTHAFTAGGTILKSLSNNHIPFLKAMFLQNRPG